jgi:hypothetical protein
VADKQNGYIALTTKERERERERGRESGVLAYLSFFGHSGTATLRSPLRRGREREREGERGRHH